MVDEIEYNLLLDIALATGCRAIDTCYIATAIITSAAMLVSADKTMVLNAKKYGVAAYYIHDVNEYEELMSRIR